MPESLWVELRQLQRPCLKQQWSQWQKDRLEALRVQATMLAMLLQAMLLVMALQETAIVLLLLQAMLMAMPLANLLVTVLMATALLLQTLLQAAARHGYVIVQNVAKCCSTVPT